GWREREEGGCEELGRRVGWGVEEIGEFSGRRRGENDVKRRDRREGLKRGEE
ncbi:hypothetical protein Tco_1122045, partial [Tanacetum coccineum]